MFDIGFWEIIVIFVVALLVVGPERLPGLARKAGLWAGQARRLVSQVKSEVERELQMEELKRSIRQQAPDDDLQRLADQVRRINADLREDASAPPPAGSPARPAVDLTKPPAGPAKPPPPDQPA